MKATIVRALVGAALAAALSGTLWAEPQIRQLGPPQQVLLGQPVYWILEIRHPLWEWYDLALQPPAGATMDVESASHRRQQDLMVTVYRVRFTAQNLVVGGPPGAVFTDSKDGVFAVRGRPVRVTPISGNSLDVRAPETPRFRMAASKTLNAAAAAAVAVLLCVLAARWWLRRRAASPRQMLLRNLKEALSHAQGTKPPDPAWLCILLRSELLWGEPVEAVTVAELAERGKRTAQHSVLSEALEKLEQARYSGGAIHDPMLLEKSVNAAIEILYTS